MRVFLSYSHADKTLAARLRRGLEERGLSFSDPSEGMEAGTSWRQRVKEAIDSSDAILLLLGSHQKADERQQLTWMLALEAVWADSAKRLIPVLLHDAELPAFVRSGASGDTIQAIRIRKPQDLGPAIEAILRTLGPRERSTPLVIRARDGKSLTVSGSGLRLNRIILDGMDIEIENHPVVNDEDRIQRRERLSAIKQYAEQLKH
jgi:hypothetical protein